MIESFLDMVNCCLYDFRITNLKYWSSSEQIISKTLQLLSDLSVGYSSVRKLVKLEEVQFMINNHTVNEFPEETLIKFSKHVKKYYMNI